MNNIINIAIERPIAVMAAVVMILLFGWVSLDRIPIQMSPDVKQPIINVKTVWSGAAPAEIEREIILPQEEALKGLDSLVKMQSSARSNQGNVELEFKVGSDMSRALLLVANRLDLISGYPEEANEPVLSTSGTEDNSIAWFSLREISGDSNDLTDFSQIINDQVKDRIERIEGISGVNINGISEKEMRVEIIPSQLAKYSITISEVINKLRSANSSITGGTVEEGKRSYVVRTDGSIRSPEDFKKILIRSKNNQGVISRVSLGDIANVELLFKERQAVAKQFGKSTITMSITGETGSNVIRTMDMLKDEVKNITDNILKPLDLELVQLYDETDYINSAINLVMQNIVVGGVLAILILMLFLKSVRATLVVSLSIPVSVIGSFVAMAILGRSLNVISLAGIAFAVGMVVDAAIIVLENIYRLREEGKDKKQAAYLGAVQVWPAVFVSALTTVMVFIPILIMELEAGQLFRDIAVAISVSVILSLIVSITLIPALSNYLLKDVSINTEKKRVIFVDSFARSFSKFWVDFSLRVIKKKLFAVLVIISITFVSIGFSLIFIPKLDYLPTGNRNFVFGFLQTPPGYNLETTSKITQKIEDETASFWIQNNTQENIELLDKPILKHFFTVALKGRAFIGGSSLDEKKASDLIPIIQSPVSSEPGTRVFMFQPSLFGRSVGGGRSIDLNISGPDLQTLFDVGKNAFQRVIKELPFEDGHRTRPLPGLDFGSPEIRVVPNLSRLSDNGLSTLDLGLSVDAFNDGLRIDEISMGNKRIDLTIAGQKTNLKTTQSIGNLPVVTRDGSVISVDSIADVVITAGPSQIRRIERERTITLSVTPKSSMPLEVAMNIINNKVILQLQKEGLPKDVKLSISGSAGKLTKTWNELIIDLLIALVIVYLVMAVLFESFIYPFIILLSVPVAAAGGIAGLVFLNIWVNQSLDMLTMLGFVILIGIVVNNAILLVHQTLYNIRKLNFDADKAISEATKNRIRPIFMSTLTSVFGMLPLVLFPGSGSELYRGLGSVVVGGLGLSAIITMAIVPPMMSITVGLIENKKRIN